MDHRIMTMKEVKDKNLGTGLRRLRYEKRLARMKERAPFDVGINVGLNIDDSILFQEYVEHQIERILGNLFISAN